MVRELRQIESAATTKFGNGTSLTLRGASGRATQWVHKKGAFRLPAEEDTNPQLDEALRAVGIVPQETIHLDVAPAKGKAGEDEVILRPARPSGTVKVVQVVLYSDESGGVSWHFPDGFLEKATKARPSSLRAFREPARPTFTIPTRTVDAQSAAKPSHLRGIVTKIGRKVFKVLIVPIVSSILKAPVKWLADKIEAKYKQDLIRAVTPDNYKTHVAKPFRGWRKLSGKRTLLIIHGIFSSTEGALSLLPRHEMEDLYRRYDGRVISYDHLTVTKHPEENARFFLEQVQKQRGRYEFDVLTHSRGGIVTRTLTERGDKLLPGHNCEFRKAYMVAVPNQGSPLGDPRHMLDMIDVFTNVLTQFPDGWVTYSIELLLGIVKLLGYTGQIALPGIASMGTEDYVLETLNASRKRCATEYAAAASNYQPSKSADNGFFRGPFVNSIMDRVFSRNGKPLKNDLVVPTKGVFAANGHPSFPIRDCLAYSASDRVWHNGFFTRPDMLDHIRSHFEVADEQPQRQVERGGRSTIDDTEESGGRGLRGYVPEGSTRRVRLRTRATSRRSPKERAAKKKATTKRTRSRKKAAPDGAPETSIHREPQIDFNELVRAGKKENLIVRLEDIQSQDVPVEKVIEIVLGTGQTAIKLTATLHAPGFDADTRSAELVVKRDRDPKTEQARFVLTARDPGPKPVTRVIRTDFWLGNQCVGTASHETVVVPKSHRGHVRVGGSATFEPLKLTGEPRINADLVIYVQSVNTPGKPPFLVQLRSTLPERNYEAKRVGTLDVEGGDLAKYLHEIYSSQFNNFPQSELYASNAEFEAAFREWQRVFVRHLRAIGKKFWDLLPSEFHHEYFALMELQQRPRSILVHSDEMILPWELMVPHRKNGRASASPPLGCSHILGRWKPGLTSKPNPQRLPVQKIGVVNPKYKGANALPFAQQEVRELRNLFSKLSVVSPASLTNIEKFLNRTDIQLLHFTGHGDYDQNNPDLNHWVLSDGNQLSALLISDSEFVRAHPVIYMNACSVGQTGMVIGRMGGFAANLLDSGCSGVIAPYWPVVDSDAMDFALEFYKQLKANRSVGEALQTLRLEHEDNATYQAFSYFGDPWAQFEFKA